MWNNMKIYFCNALQNTRNIDDVPISETYDQANMIQEVLEGVRNTVRDQVAEALPNFPPPLYPPIYDPSSQNQGRTTEMNFLLTQQANAVNTMPYAFADAIGQLQIPFAPQQGAQMHIPTPPPHNKKPACNKYRCRIR